MPTIYTKAPVEVGDMAREICQDTPCHHSIIKARVQIDFLFALAEEDENHNPIGNAITQRGMVVRALTKIIGLKDRAAGRGDAEILIDGNWWHQAEVAEQRALLDHELKHINVQTDQFGNHKTDDLRRPKLSTRLHDYEFGWFADVAQRHGQMSFEVRQASEMLNTHGQMFFPELFEVRTAPETTPVPVPVKASKNG